MRFFLFFIFLLSFSLYAAPTKLALTSRGYPSEVLLINRIMTDKKIQDEFDVLERQDMKSLEREKIISSQPLRQNFPHAELLGLISLRYDILPKSVFVELEVWDSLSRKLVQKLFPEKSPTLEADIIDALREADRKRNHQDLLGLTLEKVHPEKNITLLADWETLQHFLGDYLPAALLSYDNVVLFERNELTTILQERQVSHKIFMFAASSRIGKPEFFLGSSGNVAVKINIFDFNEVPVGNVVISDILALDFKTLKEKCAPILKLLPNTDPNDPVGEAARYFEKYQKNARYSFLVAAIALDPENPVFRKISLYNCAHFALQQYQGNENSIVRRTKTLYDPDKPPDARTKKELLTAIEKLQTEQKKRLVTMPELAEQLISTCRAIRTQKPDYPESFFPSLVLASNLLYVCGQGNRIPGDDIYREMRKIKGFGRIGFLYPGSSLFFGFFDIADAPAIREVILKELLYEIELTRLKEYWMDNIPFSYHPKMKDFYAQFPQATLSELQKENEHAPAYLNAIAKLKFLKYLCNQNTRFELLDRESQRLRIPKETIKLYNEKYYNHLYPQSTPQQAENQPSESPKPENGASNTTGLPTTEQLRQMLMNSSTERQAFELTLKLYPDKKRIKTSTNLREPIERAAFSILMTHDDFDLCNRVLQKARSPFRYEKIADFPTSMTALYKEEFYSFSPTDRKMSVMELPSGKIRELGKLDVEIPRTRGLWVPFSVTENHIIFTVNKEFLWFDKNTLALVKKQKIQIPGMALPSGGRIYVWFGDLYSCTPDGNDWKTEFSPLRSPPRFPEEKDKFSFHRISLTDEPGILWVHGNGGVYLFDFVKGKITLQEKRSDYVIWQKDNIRIFCANGRILRQTTEVKK